MARVMMTMAAAARLTRATRMRNWRRTRFPGLKTGMRPLSLLPDQPNLPEGHAADAVGGHFHAAHLGLEGVCGHDVEQGNDGRLAERAPLGLPVPVEARLHVGLRAPPGQERIHDRVPEV